MKGVKTGVEIGGSSGLRDGVEDFLKGVEIAGAFGSFFLWLRFGGSMPDGGGSFLLWLLLPVLVRPGPGVNV